MRDFDFLIPLDCVCAHCARVFVCVYACVCVSLRLGECGDPTEDSIREEELRFISGTQVQNQSGD